MDSELHLVKSKFTNIALKGNSVRISTGGTESSTRQFRPEPEFRYGDSNTNPFEAMKSKNLSCRKQICRDQVSQSVSQSISQSVNQSVSHYVSYDVSHSISNDVSQSESMSVSQSVSLTDSLSISQSVMMSVSQSVSCDVSQS